jgi:hypothetical protein
MAIGDVQPIAKVYASASASGAVTPSDSEVLDYQALYIGGGGNLAIKHTATGDAVTYAGVLAGQIYPLEGVIVMSTNTTATNIVWMRW